jgi:diacylglycerol kinase family enzyme
MAVSTLNRFRRRRSEIASTEPAEHVATRRIALIVNPYSSGMTSKREREIVSILQENSTVEVLRTERPGHGPELARQAHDEGVDIIVACGGDGTANEVINGMSIGEGTADTVPSFALIPAGGTNVFCRSLGLPNHPIAATRILAQAIAAGTHRTINLGKLDERCFLFAAGVGFDGEMVKRIEQRRKGRRPSDLAHITTVVGLFAAERFAVRDRMTISVDDTGEELRACMVMCGNTAPISYVGRMPLNVLPDCSLEHGLDFAAPTTQNARQAIVAGARSIGLLPSNDRHREGLQLHHDISGFTVSCDEPQACQADGEYLGDRTRVRFASVRNALRLIS